MAGYIVKDAGGAERPAIIERADETFARVKEALSPLKFSKWATVSYIDEEHPELGVHVLDAEGHEVAVMSELTYLGILHEAQGAAGEAQAGGQAAGEGPHARTWAAMNLYVVVHEAWSSHYAVVRASSPEEAVKLADFPFADRDVVVKLLEPTGPANVLWQETVIGPDSVR